MYMRLESNFVHHNAEGITVSAFGWAVGLDNGVTVEMPMPYMPIGNGLAVVPEAMSSGESSVKLDFSRWRPARYEVSRTYQLPLVFPSQELAVRVCRDFDADTSISWDAPVDVIVEWARRWDAVNGTGLF